MSVAGKQALKGDHDWKKIRKHAPLGVHAGQGEAELGPGEAAGKARVGVGGSWHSAVSAPGPALVPGAHPLRGSVCSSVLSRPLMLPSIPSVHIPPSGSSG